LVALLLLYSAAEVRADDLYIGQGLAPVRNFQPIQGLSLQMAGESALPLPKGGLSVRLQVSESSTILQESTPNASGVLKLNQLRPALDLRYGIFTNTELGIEIASLYHNSGGLDGFITAAESLVDKRAPLRTSLKGMGFAYDISRNGQPVLRGTNGAYGLADTTLSAKTLLVAETNYLPAIALRVALKLPTGDESRAFGTGEWDFGFGLAFQKTFLRRIVVYQNLNGIFPTGHYLGFALRAYMTSMTGVEFMVTPKFSITGQFDYHQSPFDRTGLKLLDQAITEVVLMFGYRFTQHLLWQIYGIENLDFIRDSAPDFTLGTVFTYRLGRM
jgi:hypothetical protein